MSQSTTIFTRKFERAFAQVVDGLGSDRLWDGWLSWTLAKLQPCEEVTDYLQERHSPRVTEFWDELMEGLLHANHSDPLQDYLGTAFMAFQVSPSGQKWRGQFFTPIEVSECIARMSLEGLSDTVTTEPIISMQEPAVGAGSMILAAERVIRERRASGCLTKPNYWVAVDLDRRCAQMAAIQTIINHIPAIVVCGNSLNWFGKEMAELIHPWLMQPSHITPSQAMEIGQIYGLWKCNQNHAREVHSKQLDALRELLVITPAPRTAETTSEQRSA